MSLSSLRRLTISFALASLAMTAARPARADVSSELEAADEAYRDLDFPKANSLADQILKRRRGLSHSQLVQATKLVAMTHAGMDHAAQAREAFAALLIYDPSFQVDANLGPRIMTPFFEAKGELRGLSSVPGMQVTTSGVRASEAATVRVVTRDPTRIVKRVVVGYRWGTAGSLTTKALPSAEQQTVYLPPPALSASRLDYYAQALDERENVVFEDGNPNALKVALVDAAPVARTQLERQNSFWGSGPFWVIAGVVVAGAAVAGVAYYSSTRTEREPATSSVLSPTLQCGLTRCN